MYNKHNLAVAKIAMKGDLKPELASVYFTNNHTVATDSFRLIEISVPDNVDIEEFPIMDKKINETTGAIIDARQILKIALPKCGSLPIAENLVVHQVDEENVELITTDVLDNSMNIKRVRTVPGTYPKYKEIVPKEDPLISIRINAKYLADVLNILGELDSFNNEVTLEIFADKYKPVIIKAKNKNQSGFGLVMPLSN